MQHTVEHDVIKGIRCSDLLSVYPLEGAHVLAGFGGLNKVVSGVNVMEVPDIINWVHPGEFLVTTGYAIQTQPELLLELIPSLSARGVIALGIKIKRFLNEIPVAVIELADKLDFPIIELPPATIMSDLVSNVMEKILYQETKLLSVLQNRIQTVTEAMLRGVGVQKILLLLEQLVSNPVFLMDSNGSSEYSMQTDENVELYSTLVDQVPQLDSLGHHHPGSFTVSAGSRAIKVYVEPIPNSPAGSSMLILAEWTKECTNVDLLTLERVSSLIGLELINIHVRRAIEMKYVNQFLQDWLTGRLMNDSDIFIRAEACGLNLFDSGQFTVIALRSTSHRPTMSNLVTMSERLNKAYAYQRDQVMVISTVIEETLITIVQTNSRGPVLSSILSELYKRIRSLVTAHEATPTLCLGRTVLSAKEVTMSYQMAKHIQHISKVCNIHKTCVDYHDLGAYRLLHLFSDSDDARRFQEDLLRPLREYEQKHSVDLIDTLVAYFESNRNINQAAKKLFTHYNTVSYRLEKISSVLQLDIRDPDVQLQLQIALKLEVMFR